MNNIRHLLLCLVFISLSTVSHAQIELSSGIDMSYPMLINSSNAKLNYGQISFGLKAGIAYKPSETQFFPIFNLSFGRTRLPLKQLGKNVACANFDYLNAMLNENYIIKTRNGELYFYGGIGVTFLFSRTLTTTDDQSQVTLDSTANVGHAFPAINLGLEYVYGESVGRKLYLSLGINVQYTLLLTGRNTYYMSVYEPHVYVTNVVGNLSGNMISPGFYIAVHYRLGGSKSSFYLN